MQHRLGSFFNATRGSAKKQKVKQWAWEAYPRAYEDLMKCGQYEVIIGNPEDEEMMQFRDKELFFDLNSLGQEAQP